MPHKLVFISNTSDEAKALAAGMVQEGITFEQIIWVSEKEPSKVKNVTSRVISFVKRQFHQRHVKSILDFEQDCQKVANLELMKFLGTCDFPTIDDQPQLMVESIRSTILLDTLTKMSPDFCIVYGTGIIKNSLLNTAKVCFINAHCSLLPEYRGTRSEFWQCYNQDYENVGVTFHEIDSGIDTGRILNQEKTTDLIIHEPYWLRMKNTISIIKNYPIVVKKLLANELDIKTQEENPRSQPYKFSDITFEKRLKLYERIKREVST